MARRGIVVVVQVVIPDKFLTGSDVADRKEPDASLDLVDFAVGIARMIQVSAHTLPVDHGLSVVQSVEICARNTVVTAVGFFGSDSFAGIFDDARVPLRIGVEV